MLRGKPRFYAKGLSGIILTCFACIFVFTPAFAQTESLSAEPETVSVEIPVQEEEFFNLFQEMKQTILSLYPEPIDSETLYQGAIRGLFEAIGDPYSEYLDQAEYESLTQEIEGDFSGIGVSIQLISGNITVVSVFKSSPADKAGMRSGDIIVGVDGKDLRGQKLQAASELLKGDAGTGVEVTVLRPGTGDVLLFKMVRAHINAAHALDMKDLGAGMYYIRISQFTSTTGRDFSLLMKILRGKDIKGLILDLRDNPGGLLSAAVDVAGELVPRGPIVQLRRKDIKQIINSDKDSEPIPTVILVNGGSASASEIVAGAIKDRGKAILVGERTFGKACVQTIVPLGDDLGGFKLTVAEYYTPSGAMISGVGLKPNIGVKEEPMQLPSAVPYDRDMKKGAVGLDVLALQRSLEFLGYHPGLLDGIFGPKTEKALIAFFKDYDKEYSSRVGETQVSILNSAMSQKVVNAPDNVLEEGKAILSHWLELGAA